MNPDKLLHQRPLASHAPLSFRGFVALAAMLMALNALAVDIMLPALPAMGERLGVADHNDRQLVVSAYLLGFALGQFFMGPLSDRFGRRPVLLGGLAVYTLGAAACALTGEFSWLLAARAAQGVGSAAPRVVVTALMRDCYQGRTMARVMSLVMMIFMAAPILAPSIGQALLLAGPWRGIFWALTLYGLLLGLHVARNLPETLPHDWRRPLTLSALSESASMVLGSRQSVGYALAAGALFGSLFGFINSAQQLLGEAYGMGVWFPAAFALVAGGMSVGSLANARLVEHWGMRRISHGAVIAFTVIGGALWLASLGARPPLWLLLAAICAAMSLAGLIFANFNALAMEPQARAAGVASSLIGGATTLQGALLGLLIGQYYDGTPAPLALGYLLCGALSLILLLITERGRLFGVGPA